MKKLLTAALVACAYASYAQQSTSDNACDSVEAHEAALESESEENPIFWGFGNYGFYSGYQLYGSLVNPEPTLQGYAELNANLSIDEFSLGYIGGGIWSNTDLTDRRRDSYGKAFNEWDFNIHWGYTFWFDDEQTWGLGYRTSVVWYYYPHRRHHHMNGSTATTVDWNHYVELVNPYVIPFANFVHEYHESDGNLIEFGAKKPVEVSEELSITPSATFVWRNSNYCWCFPHYGTDENYRRCGSGLATMKLMLEANYRITDNFGLFAKVAYCHIIDEELRDAAETAHGSDYGKYKDFVWGGVGLSFNF